MYDFRFVRSAFSGTVLISQMTCPAIYEEEITTIMQCAEVYWSDSPIRLLRISSALLQFLTRYTEFSLSGQIKPVSSTLTFKNSPDIQTLLSEIETDCAHIPSLEDAATQTGLSKFYFARQFRSFTGRTYWDYISQVRLKKASQLLIETDDAICKIALTCGFHDLSSFNRSFKKNMGCTPSNYRAQSK